MGFGTSSISGVDPLGRHDKPTNGSLGKRTQTTEESPDGEAKKVKIFRTSREE